MTQAERNDFAVQGARFVVAKSGSTFNLVPVHGMSITEAAGAVLDYLLGEGYALVTVHPTCRRFY